MLCRPSIFVSSCKMPRMRKPRKLWCPGKYIHTSLTTAPSPPLPDEFLEALVAVFRHRQHPAGAQSPVTGPAWCAWQSHGPEGPPQGLITNLLLSQPRSMQPLWVSADRAEVHFDEYLGRRLAGFGFLALRQVQFADQQPVLVSWCHNSTCSTLTELCCIYQGILFPSSLAADHFQHESRLCPCGRAVLRAYGYSWLQLVLEQHSNYPS